MNSPCLKNTRGFTIVELLIVIVVIGILAAITVVAYNGIQNRARNTERQTDIQAIHKALEMYYIDHGNYPKQGGVAGMDMVNYPVDALKLPRNAIITPDAATGTQNSIRETQYGNGMLTSHYGYRALTATGEACWAGSHICTTYTLWYKNDGESTARSLRSLNG